MFATKYTSWCFFCKSFEENQPFLETVGLWWCVSFDFGYMVRGEIIINESPENQSLGRGFKYFSFSPLFGEDEPILANIFQISTCSRVCWSRRANEPCITIFSVINGPSKGSQQGDAPFATKTQPKRHVFFSFLFFKWHIKKIPGRLIWKANILGYIFEMRQQDGNHYKLLLA